jgi:hypothetical protein
VRLLHLVQRGSLVEVVIRQTPHDADYVELPLVDLKNTIGIERQIHIMQVM